MAPHRPIGIIFCLSAVLSGCTSYTTAGSGGTGGASLAGGLFTLSSTTIDPEILAGAKKKEKGHARPTAGQDVIGMPEFPSTPPRPCARMAIPMSWFRRAEEAKLGALDQQIREALVQAGYAIPRYYRFKEEGFAIVTPVEEFKDDGTSQTGPHRFVANLQDFGTGRFDISRIFDRIVTFFTGKIGQYRLFVIIVSSQQSAPTEKKMSLSEAQNLWEAGWTNLPSSMAKAEWNDDIRVELLIYEFETREGVAPGVRQPTLTAETHLRKSGILKESRH